MNHESVSNSIAKIAIGSPALNAIVVLGVVQLLVFNVTRTPGPIGYPCDFSLLASLCWLFWNSPASFRSRTGFVLFAIGYCRWRASFLVEFPVLFLSLGYFLIAYSVSSSLVGLRGWKNIWELADETSSRHRFSIASLLLLMVALVPLCLASRIVGESFARIDFVVATTGLAISVVLVQHSFTTSSRNLYWAFRAGFVSLLTVVIVAVMRGFRYEVPHDGIAIHGEPNNWFYCHYWLDLVFSFSITFLFVGLFAARVGWLIVEQKCEEQRKNALQITGAE